MLQNLLKMFQIQYFIELEDEISLPANILGEIKFIITYFCDTESLNFLLHLTS